jgi:hypothetical protein
MTFPRRLGMEEAEEMSSELLTPQTEGRTLGFGTVVTMGFGIAFDVG